jgi:hypothetical protein
MPRSSDSFVLRRKGWLLSIGRRLRADYDALREPVPEGLGKLVQQLEQASAISSAASEKPLGDSLNPASASCSPDLDDYRLTGGGQRVKDVS